MSSATPDPSDPLPVEVSTAAEPSASVIWLHGLGADGHDFESIVPDLRLPAKLGVRFVFPHAPMRPVALNGGYVMRAWYDLALTESGFVQEPDDIEESVGIVNRLIEMEAARGIPARRMVLGGFSQGGAIALHTGLRYAKRLGGIVALSAPVPLVETLVGEIHPANVAVPILMAHGTEDTVVPFDYGNAVRRVFARRGLKVEWHEYPMGHTVISEEIAVLARWLTRVLVSPAPPEKPVS
jgi:phospholipase/carboxylesterase